MVYNDYHVKLYRYFLKKTGDGETAKELVQLAYIKLWRCRHTLSETLSVNQQLFVIARSTIVDHIRHKTAYKHQAVSLDNAPELSYTDSDFEESDYINKAVHSLPPVRKKIFIMSRIRGFQYKEIAKELSISVNTVEDHMSKALLQIKSITSFLLSLFVLMLQQY